MANETAAPTSRRALISAGIGSMLGMVAAALAHPSAVEATDGDYIRVGYNFEGDRSTTVTNNDPNGTAFIAGVGGAGVGLSGSSNTGYAVYGEAPGGRGVFGVSTSGIGVAGASGSSTAVQGISTSGSGVLGSSTSQYGVYGLTTAGSGVVGKSTSGPGVSGISDSHNGVQGSSKAATGVAATSDSGAGMRGKSTSGPGVHGESSSNNGVEGIASTATGVYGQSTAGAGVWAYTDAANVPALIGQGGTDGTGVLGLSGPGTPTAGPRLTGVYGYAAQSTASRGVYGQSTVGAGVIGEATSGIGVQASASSGVALRVSGRAAFSRSGRASVPAKANHVDVVVPGGLSSSASVLATLQLPRGTVHVTSARINYPKAGTVRISLNAVASTTASTPVAWFVLG